MRPDCDLTVVMSCAGCDNHLKKAADEDVLPGQASNLEGDLGSCAEPFRNNGASQCFCHGQGDRLIAYFRYLVGEVPHDKSTCLLQEFRLSGTVLFC